MEIWKDIKGYIGLYQVSNYGRIKSLDRIVKYSNCRSVNYKSKIRKSSNSEYRLIALSKFGNVKMIKISRLVALHFLPIIKGKNIVNHKDGNKYNDNVFNLEWCNHSENSLHAYKNNLKKSKNKCRGVSFDKGRGKWMATLYRNNKSIFIGRYNTEDEAIKNYKIKLNDFNKNKAAICK